MDQLTGLIVMGVAALVVIGILWYVVTRFLVNIGAKEVGIKERRYMGRRMPQGSTVNSTSHQIIVKTIMPE